jgi:L-amino acid N-acyltransferase YncA
MDDVAIRDATPEDAEAVAAIYGHHVLHGTASYDLVPPPADTMRKKIEWVLGAGWPFLVGERDGPVVGYAYATQFRDRDAYRFTAEDSIYVHPAWMGRGFGGALLEALIERCGMQGFRTIIAVVGGADPRSIALHAKRGFREAGRLSAVGWKHDRWLDSVYMQLELRPAADY